MATRRPRVKPAAILKQRRPPTTLRSNVPVSNTADNDVTQIEEQPKLIDDVDKGNDNKSLINQIEISDSGDKHNGINVLNTDATTSNADSMVLNKSEESNAINNVPPPPAPKPFRRMLTPAVNIPVRRKPSVVVNLAKDQLDAAKPSQTALSPAQPQDIAVIRSPSPTRADTKPILIVKNEDAGTAATINFLSPTKDEFPLRRGTIDNDECFKSPPFMSPSMQYSRRQDPSASPFTDAFGDEFVKSPSSISSQKIRQRIRPTPYFMARRNSIQVSER